LNKIGKISGKVANGVGKAQAIGLLEEEEWEISSGISGEGGKPSWNVGVSHKWEQEQDLQEEQQGGVLTKLNPLNWFKSKPTNSTSHEEPKAPKRNVKKPHNKQHRLARKVKSTKA